MTPRLNIDLATMQSQILSCSKTLHLFLTETNQQVLHLTLDNTGTVKRRKLLGQDAPGSLSVEETQALFAWAQSLWPTDTSFSQAINSCAGQGWRLDYFYLNEHQSLLQWTLLPNLDVLTKYFQNQCDTFTWSYLQTLLQLGHCILIVGQTGVESYLAEVLSQHLTPLLYAPDMPTNSSHACVLTQPKNLQEALEVKQRISHACLIYHGELNIQNLRTISAHRAVIQCCANARLEPALHRSFLNIETDAVHLLTHFSVIIECELTTQGQAVIGHLYEASMNNQMLDIQVFAQRRHELGLVRLKTPTHVSDLFRNGLSDLAENLTIQQTMQDHVALPETEEHNELSNEQVFLETPQAALKSDNRVYLEKEKNKAPLTADLDHDEPGWELDALSLNFQAQKNAHTPAIADSAIPIKKTFKELLKAHHKYPPISKDGAPTLTPPAFKNDLLADEEE